VHIDVVTLFPEMIREHSGYGIQGRAIENGLLELQTWNPREYTADRNGRVDDRPYGGGPGMVMTVEPGLYVPAGIRGVKRWWNIGVRIEDDVAVTRDGNEVLSAGLPRTCDEIEAVMNSEA